MPRRKNILHASSTLGRVQGNCYAAADAAETANSPNLDAQLQALALVKTMDALRAAAKGVIERMAFLERHHGITAPQGFYKQDASTSESVTGGSDPRSIDRGVEQQVEIEH